MRGALFPASLGITATAPLPEQAARAINPQDLAICDNRFVLDWHRLTADHRLTFGSGTSCSGANISGITDTLRPSIEATYPRLIGIAIDYEWFGQDGIIINRTPHLGRISRNLFHAKGYSGHGIATSHIVAEIMGRAITGGTWTSSIPSPGCATSTCRLANWPDSRHWRRGCGTSPCAKGCGSA